MTGQRFVQALTLARHPIVMEIKKRDGSGRDLVGGRSLRELVNRYEDADAPCLSVVTSPVFGGTASLLSDVAQLTTVPILVKDFIVREKQIVEASMNGASAVLLTASILPAHLLDRLITTALDLAVTPVIETVNSRQLQRVRNGQHCVVAVNNRDIAVRERNGPSGVARSLDLIADVRRTGTKCAVSASGVETPEAAVQLLSAGYQGLLVGGALLRAPNVKQWIERVAELSGGKGPEHE